MTRTSGFLFTVAAAAFALSLGGLSAPLHAQQGGAAAVQIDNNDIGGVVTSAHGPEAGAWVIAETTDLPTKFVRIVVTDDQGRYVIPDLPSANYRVWVRGYGLVDSPKMHGVPGQHLNLTAVVAPTAREAAHYYPAIYWYSMLKIPGKDQFGGSSDIPKKVTQEEWLRSMKNRDCVGCHQFGQQATRTLPAAFSQFKSGEEAWIRRVQSGQSAKFMVGRLAGELGGVPFKYLGDWTDSIADGALPSHKPPRPQGVERNIVITEWSWGSPETYLHDEISTDKRNPTVNGHGLIYGSPEYSTDELPVLDPKTNKVWTIHAPKFDPNMPVSLGPGHAAMLKPMAPSAYWGDEVIWKTYFNTHNGMFDGEGRVWFTATTRGPKNPDECWKPDSALKWVKDDPIKANHRQLAVYDPKTKKFTPINTCFGTHHLQFGFDKDNTLWTSGSGLRAAWLDSKVFLETGDVNKAQGWSPFILDTNGNGKRDAFAKWGKAESGKDLEVGGRSGTYAVMPNPADGSVWFTTGVFGGPGSIVRYDPKTGLSELYDIPKPGFGPRGGDIDSNGVVWVSLGSGHLGSFDRSKCKGPLNGPKATGHQCPEGWSFHQYPGPGFAGIGENSAEASYYTWVDQHNTLGLGNNVPISTGNENDGLLALVDGKFVTMRIPYPLSFYAKGLDGRIDDSNAGWKGRGVWSTEGDRTPWLKEGGKGSLPIAVHFQVRPNPLAH